MALVVIKPGMLTTVQDRGRWGYQSRGVPVAGPMDPVAHRLANAIAGNPPEAALLEITLLGPEITFDDARTIAVAGAEFELSIDGTDVPMHAPVPVPASARLRFGRRLRGARAYLAVEGGIASPPTLGSRSTHVISGMGGVEGRPLRSGDRLPLGPRTERLRISRGPALPIVPILSASSGPARLRVLPGPQQDLFAADALDILQSAPYTMAQNSDRMGFRLEGPTLPHAGSADIISDATPLGVLQVPASGQPILLMADRQTSGGYPKIATLITADLAVAGQLAPGDRIAFEVCTSRDAIAALIAQEQALLRAERR
jgi:antagonist of KipI